MADELKGPASPCWRGQFQDIREILDKFNRILLLFRALEEGKLFFFLDFEKELLDSYLNDKIRNTGDNR